MMGLLFIHGHERLKEDVKGNYYTDGSYNQEVWDRYLNLSSEVNVIFKKDPIKYNQQYALDNFQPFNKNKIKYIEIPDLVSSYLTFINPSRRRKVNQIIENAIIQNDASIIRLPSSEGLRAVKYSIKHNKPYLIELVGCPWNAYFNHSFKGKIVAPFMWCLTRKIIKNAPYVVYVTNEFLQRRYPCKGANVGCSDVTLPPLDESILERRLDKIRQIDKSKSIIIGTTAAVNVRYKGQEYVIKAISKLNKEGFNFEYHLVGGGNNSYLHTVARKYNVLDKIKFLGSIPHEKIFDYLDDIDIYIQPSKTEGMPRALLEAMSRGCPAIGSDVGDIPELLNNDFIFRKKETNEICTLLKKIINMNIMAKEAKNNFDKVKEFSKSLLDNKRNKFYLEFKNNVSSKLIKLQKNKYLERHKNVV